MLATLPLLEATDVPAIHRGQLDTLQVNLGSKGHPTCVHCHVNAGPSRQEMMSDDTIELIIEVLNARRIQTLDLTGGAPEMHPRFRELVAAATEAGVQVMDRLNLTPLTEPGYETMAELRAAHPLPLAASMPYSSPAKVDQRRA